MASELLVDTSKLNVARPLHGKDDIRAQNPQRFEMEMLDGILLQDEERQIIAGYYDVRRDAWWARGHFPDRPMLPGVLGLEAAGQLCSFYFHKTHPDLRMGLGAIETVKFRLPVEPPTTLFIVAKVIAVRARFGKFQFQGIVNNQIAFEAIFIGAAL